MNEETNDKVNNENNSQTPENKGISSSENNTSSSVLNENTIVDSNVSKEEPISVSATENTDKSKEESVAATSTQNGTSDAEETKSDDIELFIPKESDFISAEEAKKIGPRERNIKRKSKRMLELMEEEGLTEEEFYAKYGEAPKEHEEDEFEYDDTFAFLNEDEEDDENAPTFLEKEEARYKKEKRDAQKAEEEAAKKARAQAKKEAAEKEAAEEKKRLQEEAEEYNNEMADNEEFPDDITDVQLEYIYIGILLNNPKAISRFYFLYDECLFSNDALGNLYKIILFQDGEEFAPQVAKDKFKFPKEDIGTYDFKVQCKNAVGSRSFNVEFIYTKLKKLFLLKKFYAKAPTGQIQKKIVEIVHYERYEEMSIEEVENAIEQIGVTNRLSQVILNENATEFLLAGESTLTGGVRIPFNIMCTAFKGLRRGETFVYAMPSNYGKSRFTTFIGSYLALVEHKKVLILSNEMSEEKIRLCFYTTVLNNPEIQKLHGHKLHKQENELLDLQFRADPDAKDVEVDEKGFILKRKGESRADFIKRISKASSEFKETIQVTEWLKEQVKINNCIHFVHITDNKDDEVKKIVMNYFYHYNIEYAFYDTLKTDAEHIGDSDALKKTATILSNIAQKYHMFIGASMQLLESSTLPVNLTINEMSHSKTVKEVLDTLALFKQINPHTYNKYEYSEIEVSDDYRDIEATKDPDERFYCCVIDKNRAGPKPTLLFRLNLAYNSWEELGYVRLKEEFLDMY